MKIKTLFVFGMSLLSLWALSSAQAQGHVGNGGDALVCGSTVRLLDHYEAELRGMPIGRIEGNSIREKVEGIVEAVLRNDRGNGMLLKIYTSAMLDEVELYEKTQKTNGLMVFKNVNLSDVDDSQELYIPLGCSKQQLVTQQSDKTTANPLSIEKAKYIVQSRLWSEMDDDNRALTLMHEAWYRIALLSQAKNSIFTRYINAVTALKPSYSDYANALSKAPIASSEEVQSVEVRRSSYSLYKPSTSQIDRFLPFNQERALYLNQKSSLDSQGLRCHGIRGVAPFATPATLGKLNPLFDRMMLNLQSWFWNFGDFNGLHEVCFDITSGDIKKIKFQYVGMSDNPFGLAYLIFLKNEKNTGLIKRGSAVKFIGCIATFGLSCAIDTILGKRLMADVEYLTEERIRITIGTPDSRTKYKLNNHTRAKKFKVLEISAVDGEILSVQ